jgi:putative FmdB family regulatory protein
MPLYEYLCGRCGEVSEVIQRFADAPLETCPREGCGGPVTKQISATSFSLKGSGWYTTDYKRSAKPSAPAAEKPATTEKPAPAGETHKPSAD